MGSGPLGLSAFGSGLGCSFVPRSSPAVVMAAEEHISGFVLRAFLLLTGEEREGIRPGVYGRERGGMKAGAHDSAYCAGAKSMLGG